MKSSTARPRLLLVEDDRATYTALRGILSLRGWDVVIATTIAEALEAMKSDLDAVILDLILPDGDGELLLQHLRSDERGRGMPVAVTTGVNDLQRIAAVERLRPTVLLRKPIALNDLLKAIKARKPTVTPPD
jgi:DNA-binding response OmpR family regulator